MIPVADLLPRRRQPPPAPDGITWLHHTSIRMPRHPNVIVFGDWHPPAAPGFAVTEDEPC